MPTQQSGADVLRIGQEIQTETGDVLVFQAISGMNRAKQKSRNELLT